MRVDLPHTRQQHPHKRSRRSTLSTIASSVSSLVLLVCLASSSAPTAAGAADSPLVSGATCSKSKTKAVKSCLKDIYAQEEALPKGPCYSEDWDCVCRMQQGILDCWEDAGCGDAQPRSQVEWNQANCAGQHDGIRNLAAGGEIAFDLSKVASASGVAPTATGKHKHHKSEDEAASTSTDTAASTSTAAPSSTAAGSSSAAGAAPTSISDYVGISVLSVNPSHSYGGPATALASFTATPIITSSAPSSLSTSGVHPVAVVLFSSVAVAALLGSVGL
ncbi:hypothetical protein OC861_006576 [Tilletia horrida]|nr:hypothetical protein OC861_006576 [Tilletia horrida]